MWNELSPPAEDGVTRVQFRPKANPDQGDLLVASWDKTARLWDTAVEGGREVAREQFRSPVLDACFLGGQSPDDGAKFVAGLLDGRVEVRDFARPDDKALAAGAAGRHEGGVRRVCAFTQNPDRVVTGSWDSTVKFWDLRSNNCCTDTLAAEGKIFAMALSELNSIPRLLVCDSTRRVAVWDTRKLDEPEQSNSQLLKYQIRDCAWHPNEAVFTVASVEGRVAWETLAAEGEDVKKANYTFKCHREKAAKTETVHTVNALAFHPVAGSFATGGSDGNAVIWDGKHKKRLWKANKSAGIPVTSLSFSASMETPRLAVGCAADAENAECRARVMIRTLQDTDIEKAR